jgi:hypothetical protein
MTIMAFGMKMMHMHNNFIVTIPVVLVCGMPPLFPGMRMMWLRLVLGYCISSCKLEYELQKFGYVSE